MQNYFTKSIEIQNAYYNNYSMFDHTYNVRLGAVCHCYIPVYTHGCQKENAGVVIKKFDCLGEHTRPCKI